jgi:hypothetical protein
MVLTMAAVRSFGLIKGDHRCFFEGSGPRGVRVVSLRSEAPGVDEVFEKHARTFARTLRISHGRISEECRVHAPPKAASDASGDRQRGSAGGLRPRKPRYRRCDRRGVGALTASALVE